MAEHSLRLPSFDELKIMAQEEPEALEELRQRLTAQLIQNASPRGRRRLQGLAFVIDAERRKAHNPMQACIRLSQMMLDSAVELQASLDLLRTTTRPLEKTRDAEIIPFVRRRSGS
ncbi:DUF3135 domain-containing protein [Halopseudomonas sp.]|uniref:DUF3135 domain-containing protein n=1 Tax=Halopseudomonas sp. TaxID=2901191 RepID=UPI0035687E18